MVVPLCTSLKERKLHQGQATKKGSWKGKPADLFTDSGSREDVSFGTEDGEGERRSSLGRENR